MLEGKGFAVLGKFIQQIGACLSQGRRLGKEGAGKLPAAPVHLIPRQAVKITTPLLHQPQHSQRSIFIQLVAHRRFIRLTQLIIEAVEITAAQQLQQLCRRIGLAVGKNIQQIKMQRNIHGRKALGLPAFV